MHTLYLLPLGLFLSKHYRSKTSASRGFNRQYQAICTFPRVCARIHEVSFYNLFSPAWDDAPSTPDSDVVPGPVNIDSALYRDNYSSSGAPVFEDPCLPLTKLLSSGSFYYALEPQWGLSSQLSARLCIDETLA